MILHLNKVILQNFLSFKYAEIKLDKSGYILVSGKNENPDDCAKSNGSGKSTIFESVVWGLTGETIRGTKDVKRFGAGKKEHCVVTLEFTADGNEYKLIRVKDPANLTVFLNGEDISSKGIRDTQHILEERLPELSAQLIGSVIVLGQGLPMRFSNNSPAGRKDVLEKLSKSDFMIDDLKERVNHRKAELDFKAKEIEKDISVSRVLKDEKYNQREKNKNELNILNNIDYDILLDAETQKLTPQLTELDNFTKEKDTLQVAYDEVMVKQNSLSKNKYNEKISLTESYEPKVKEKNSSLIPIKERIAVLKAGIADNNNIKTHCPTCHQPLMGINKPDITPLKNELVEKENILKLINDEIIAINSEKQLKLNEIDNKYYNDEINLNNTISKYKSDINSLTFKINSLQNTVYSIKTKIAEIELQKKNYEYKVSQLNENIITLTKEIEEQETKVKNLCDNLTEIKMHSEVISKFDVSLKRDFRGILLNNIISYIDTKAKEYSNIVFGTDKLDFVLDGNDISILYDKKDYQNLSGGEKQRIDLIVQFALRDMLCKYLNFSSNILVLDEIVDNLDSLGCQKVMELISKKLNDVEGIYIISHHADISMPMDHELIITKDKEGISSASN